MKKIIVIFGIAAVGGIIGIIVCFSKRQRLMDDGVDRQMDRLVQRIKQINYVCEEPKTPHEFGKRLVDDICAVSNRETQAMLMRLFAQSVKALSSNNLDLRLRYDELSRCRLLTEQGCTGFRRIGDYVDDIWELRFAMLSRYIAATNECLKELKKISGNEHLQEHVASHDSHYMISGQRQSGWQRKIAGDLDHYLAEITMWHYRVDTKQLPTEERKKMKFKVEQIVGKKLRFFEPQ